MNEPTTTELLQGIYDLLKGQAAPQTSQTFGAWLKEWYELYKLPKGLKPSYTRKLETEIFDYISPALGGFPLSALDGVAIQTYLNGIAAPVLRKQIAQIINASLEKACRLRKIAYNPYRAVELPPYRKRHYKPLEYAQQNAVLALPLLPHYCAAFWVLCCTGTRIGEFLAIDFTKDIDRKAGVIRITKAIDITTGQPLDRPKTDTSEREIPYTPELSPHLETLKAYQDSGRRFTYDGISNYFKRVYKKLGYHGLNLHSLRHTFISLCYAAHIPEKAIQTYAGHSAIEVTLNIYTHILAAGNSPLLDYIRTLKEKQGF